MNPVAGIVKTINDQPMKKPFHLLVWLLLSTLNPHSQPIR